MNIGIQDAYTLGVALADAARDNDTRRLDRYDYRRRPVAREVVALTDRMTRLATLKPGWRQSLRNALVPVLSHIPPLRRRMLMSVSELKYREFVG